MKTTKRYLLLWNHRFDFIEVELKYCLLNKAVVQITSTSSTNLLFVNCNDLVDKTKENKKVLTEMRKMADSMSRKLVKMRDKLMLYAK